MFLLGFLVVVVYLLYRFYKPAKLPKEDPIDYSKDSAYYLQEYPELLQPNEPLHQNKKEEQQPNITINITNNHLHVYPQKDWDSKI